MLVLGAGRVTSSAVKKSKERKKLTFQRSMEKAEVERQAADLLRKNKQEAFKSIAVNYVTAQQQAIQQKQEAKKKETQKNIAIAIGVGLVVITIGIIAYKKSN